MTAEQITRWLADVNGETRVQVMIQDQQGNLTKANVLYVRTSTKYILGNDKDHEACIYLEVPE